MSTASADALLGKNFELPQEDHSNVRDRREIYEAPIRSLTERSVTKRFESAPSRAICHSAEVHLLLA